MSDPAQDAAPLSAVTDVPAEPLGRIAELALEARPAEVTDSGRNRLFEAWEKSGVVIQRAEQMRLDAIKHQIECAEAIVKKLGGGAFRYKGKLYMVMESTRGVVFLREQKAKKKDG